jgi:hypothetical protein
MWYYARYRHVQDACARTAAAKRMIVNKDFAFNYCCTTLVTLSVDVSMMATDFIV